MWQNGNKYIPINNYFKYKWTRELELLARGLFPLPLLNCPRAREEGGLTEAAVSGGSPTAEAVTILETVGRSCGWQALGAPARCQGCASEVGEPSSEHWSTRYLPVPCNIKWWKSPSDPHLNAKTQFHSVTTKLQCWTTYAKQLAKQGHNPIP